MHRSQNPACPPCAQVLQANVQRGSRVYERGHLLVLAWAEAQRDQEVIWKILSQVRLLCSRGLCCAQLSVKQHGAPGDLG